MGDWYQVEFRSGHDWYLGLVDPSERLAVQMFEIAKRGGLAVRLRHCRELVIKTTEKPDAVIAPPMPRMRLVHTPSRPCRCGQPTTKPHALLCEDCRANSYGAREARRRAKLAALQMAG